MRDKERYSALTRVNVVAIIFLIASVSVSFVNSALTQHTIIDSSGSIFYETHIVFESNTMLYTGLGQDYLLHYSDEDPNIWTRYGTSTYYQDKLMYWKQRGYKSSRLMFTFDTPSSFVPLDSRVSIYDENKMDWVVDFFHLAGVTVILDMHDNDKLNYYGSQEYIDSWLDVTTHYKDDSRIAGFNIANEPSLSDYSGHDLGALSGPAGRVDSNAQLVKAFVYLTREIHKVDPNRIVFFPTYVMLRPTIDIDTWITYIGDSGNALSYDILNDPYVIFDIAHPYYFENAWDGGMTPEEKAESYAQSQIIPAVQAFGASRCWVGETFAWQGLTYEDGMPTDPYHQAPHTADSTLQTRWLTSIINVFVRYEVSFQVLGFFDKVALEETAMYSSNYMP
jgi:hypothetical protein